MKRRFGLICLMILLALSITVFLSSCDPTEPDDGGSTGDPECEHVFGEWELREEATCKLQALEVRECTLCDATEERREGKFASHDYGEFVLVEENDCLRTGKAIRTCTECGDEDVTYVLGDHKLGAWTEAKAPTLFENGCLGYYECSACGKSFDRDHQLITDAIIPKLEARLSVCLDGTPSGELTVLSEGGETISLSLSDLSVSAGQSVSFCLTDDPTVIFEYTVVEELLSSLSVVYGNIDPTTKKIRTTSTSDLELILNKNGTAQLSMNGYVHSGMVVEITSSRSDNMPVLFPMSYTDYYDDPEMKAYVFGLFGSDESTSLRIIDMDTDTVYDYDDLSDTNAWDKWSYSRGTSGEIVFAEGLISDWWLAFDIGGDGKITLTRHNLPNVMTPSITVFDGDTAEMEKVTLEVGSDEYKYYTWPLTNEAFSRQDVWLDRIDLENIYIYRGVLSAEAGDSFYIGNDYSIKPWTLLSTVYVEGNAIDDYRGTVRDGFVTKTAYGITLENAGTYVIEYIPFCNVINIIEIEDFSDGYVMYLDGEFIDLEETDGCLTYELEADEYTNVAFLRGDYTFLPVSISEDTPSGIANVIETDGTTMLFFSRAGKYTLSYNISSGTVTITPKDGEITPPEDDPALPMSIYISFDNKLTLIENPDNPDEMCYLGLTMGAWDEFKVWDTDRSYISDMTLAAGTTGIVTDGRIITFQTAGSYDFYINKTTHQVRFVAASSGEGGDDIGGGDDPITSEEYIIYHEGSFISVYSEGNTFKYTGLAVSAGDTLSIHDSGYERLPVSFDPSVDTSLAKLKSSYNMFSFVWNCKADLTYNVETGVLMIDIYDVTYANALVYLFYGDTYEEAYSDGDGIVTKRFEFSASANIYIDNSAFETLPMILHEDSDRSLVTVMTFGEGSMLYIPNAGIYDLTYDLNSKIFTFEAVTEAEPDPDPTPDPDGEIIDRIDILGITMPYTGEKPATDDEPYALQEGVEIISVDWGEETYDESTDKIVLDPFGADYRFETSGDRYYIRARIRIKDGYQLAYGVEDLPYELIATINYVRCWTIQVDGDIIELYTYIGCNDTTVSHVGVVGVDGAVPGELPDSDFTCVYEGFHVGDVFWYDYTESDGTFETARLMADGETFVEGGFYQVHIVLEADEGHEFAVGYYGPGVTVFINEHETAAEFYGDADPRYQILLTWFFDCE